MTERRSEDPGSSGVLAVYCAEMDRLATTLCTLLEVVDRHTDLSFDHDLVSILALEPPVARLRELLARRRLQVVAGNTTTTDATDWLDEQTIEDMCRSAVHSTVAEMLAARDEPWADGLDQLLGSASESADSATAPDEAIDETVDPVDEEARPTVRVVRSEQTLGALLDDVGRWSALHGTADTMPIPGLFTMLASSRKTGCLHLRRVDEHLRFVIDHGVVVATATTRPESEERLGEMLVARDWLTPERRQELVDLAGSSQQPFGAVAIDEGDISVEQLAEALQEQVHARFHRVFEDRATAYAFVESDGQDVDGRIFVHAHDLLFRCARNADQSLTNEPA